MNPQKKQGTGEIYAKLYPNQGGSQLGVGFNVQNNIQSVKKTNHE